MRLRRIDFAAIGIPEPEPLQEQGAWQLVTLLDGMANDDTLFTQIRNLKDRRDQKNALAALRKLVKIAATGQPLAIFYDEKQCHPIHEFRYRGKDRKIWRIRHGDVRLAFYYGTDRLIFLPVVFAKRSDKLTNAQRSDLETRAGAFIDAEVHAAIEIVEPDPDGEANERANNDKRTGKSG